jgi:hypothetical protein
MMSRRPSAIPRREPQRYKALNHLSPEPQRMGRGALYEYYKRMGMLEVYFALFPGS